MYGIYENGAVIAKFTAPLTVKSNVPISVSDTLSLKRQVIKRGGAQRWEIETNLEPLSDNSQNLFVNLVSKGFSETVTILMPQNYGAKRKRTALSDNPNATGTVNSSQISVLNLTGLLPKGTFIKFENHSKIYLTTSDLINEGVLNIFPVLRTNINNAIFTYKDDVIMNCLYDTNVVSGMLYSDGILMDVGTVNLIEKL
jgi:hypothetical protein